MENEVGGGEPDDRRNGKPRGETKIKTFGEEARGDVGHDDNREQPDEESLSGDAGEGGAGETREFREREINALDALRAGQPAVLLCVL